MSKPHKMFGADTPPLPVALSNLHIVCSLGFKTITPWGGLADCYLISVHSDSLNQLFSSRILVRFLTLPCKTDCGKKEGAGGGRVVKKKLSNISNCSLPHCFPWRVQNSHEKKYCLQNVPDSLWRSAKTANLRQRLRLDRSYGRSCFLNIPVKWLAFKPNSHTVANKKIANFGFSSLISNATEIWKWNFYVVGNSKLSERLL